MKRALAICTALMVVGVAGFGFTISGKWAAEILLIGTGAPSLTSTSLTLNYGFDGWTITSVSGFTGAAGFNSQKFDISGAFGPLTITGNMTFNPTGAAYTSSWIKAALDFAGLSGYLKVEHAILTATSTYGCQTGSQQMVYTLYGAAAPVSLTVKFVDCCEGIEFYSALISLKGLGLCCGITYDAELSFTKAVGFDYVKFTAKDIFPICCGISFDASVKFTTTGKTVTLTPKFAGFGEACFELYADIVTAGGTNEDLFLNAIRIDGWKIRCDIADCNYIEYVTFLSPANVTLYEPWATDGSPFKSGEFEYIKLGFCGPGCCGGTYSVGLSVYFGTGGTLFDITRLAATATVPLMSNFSFTLKFSTGTAPVSTDLSIGWTFTF